MYSEIIAKFSRKWLPQMKLEKKMNKPCDKFCWVNQDLSQGKNNTVEIKLNKPKLRLSSLKSNTYSNDFIQNMSKSFQTTSF